MRRRYTLLITLTMILAACGGAEPAAPDDGGAAVPSDNGSDDGPSSGGEVVNKQPPGMGYASVDGLEYTFDTPGALACRVAEDDFGFSYIIGDNEVGLAGGATIINGEWSGSLSLRVAGDDGETSYRAKLSDGVLRGIAIDGDSVSYSGPMEQPIGVGVDAVDVGDGVFSATC